MPAPCPHNNDPLTCLICNTGHHKPSTKEQ